MISPLVLFSGKVNKAVRRTYHIFFQFKSLLALTPFAILQKIRYTDLKACGFSDVKLTVSGKTCKEYGHNAESNSCAGSQVKREKAKFITEKLRKISSNEVTEFIESTAVETLSYIDFPYKHRTRLHTNNTLKWIMKEIRCRIRVIRTFPGGYSAMMSVGARHRHISTTKWGIRQYLSTCKTLQDGVN